MVRSDDPDPIHVKKYDDLDDDNRDGSEETPPEEPPQSPSKK